MDRLFDTFLGGGFPTFPSIFGSGVGRSAMLVPRMDVKETDKEIIIEAELPGLEEKDVSLTLQNGILTVQGEKKIEYDEEKENYHMMERSYGSFQRSLRLPDTVDEDKVEARFENGILRVTLPKRSEAGVRSARSTSKKAKREQAALYEDRTPDQWRPRTRTRPNLIRSYPARLTSAKGHGRTPGETLSPLQRRREWLGGGSCPMPPQSISASPFLRYEVDPSRRIDKEDVPWT